MEERNYPITRATWSWLLCACPVISKQESKKVKVKGTAPQLFISKALKGMPCKNKRRKTSSVQSFTILSVWIHMGPVMGSGFCLWGKRRVWDMVLGLVNIRPAAQSLHIGREGLTEPLAFHRPCVCCWECFHSILFKEGAFWPDLTSKKFKFS